MTLEDLLIGINEDKELKEDTLTISVTQKGKVILSLYSEGIEKHQRYLTDELLIRQIKREYGDAIVVKILGD